jgi:hypothetical protein
VRLSVFFSVRLVDGPKSEVTTGVLAPGQELWSPVRNYSEAGFRLLLRRSVHFKWSPLVCLRQAVKLTTIPFTCRPDLSHDRSRSSSTDSSSSVASTPDSKSSSSSRLSFSSSSKRGSIDVSVPPSPRQRRKVHDFSGILVPEADARDIFVMYSLRPAVILENALACDMRCRLVEGGEHAADADEVDVARGTEIPVYTCAVHLPVLFSLQIPTLGCGWTAIPILLSAHAGEDSRGRRRRHKPIQVSAVDSMDRELMLSIEVSTVHGSLRIAVFVPYWIFDMTHLNLRLSEDMRRLVPGMIATKKGSSGSKPPTPSLRPKSTPKDTPHLTATGTHITGTTGPSVTTPIAITDDDDERKAVMFSFSLLVSKHRRVCLRATQPETFWSSPFTLDSIGSTTAISLRCTPQMTTVIGSNGGLGSMGISGECPVGIKISAGSGRYKRTKMVTLVPHLVLVNRLPMPIQLRQHNTALSTSIILQPCQPTPYMWPDHAQAKTLAFRRVGPEYNDWHWSGDVAMTEVGENILNVHHHGDPDAHWFARVEVRVKGPSLFAIFDAPDQHHQLARALEYYLPYRIENRCVNETIRFRQWLAAPQAGRTTSSVGHHPNAGHTTRVPLAGSAIEELAWCELRPYTSVPYAWESPVHRGLTPPPPSISSSLRVTVLLVLIIGWIEIEMGLRKFGREGHRYEKRDHYRLDDVEDLATVHLSPPWAQWAGDDHDHRFCEGHSTPIYIFVESDGPTNV